MTSTHLKFITWHDIDASSLNLIGRPRPTAIEETVIHRRHQTPSDANWHNLTPSDTTWHNLMPSEPSNAIWHNLTLSDAIWKPSDVIWRHLTSSDTSESESLHRRIEAFIDHYHLNHYRFIIIKELCSSRELRAKIVTESITGEKSSTRLYFAHNAMVIWIVLLTKQ